MKKLLLVVGPQGSGNHMFSKIFSLHPDVYGWRELNSTYWIQHDQEPFNKFWINPELFLTEDFGGYNYATVSISVPYVQNGTTVTPNFENFINHATQAGWIVQVLVIGRDQNVLEHQQTRLRKRVTLPQLIDTLTVLDQYNPVYISHELACLYGLRYIKSLGEQLEFPVDYNNALVPVILGDNANKKYFSYVETTKLDAVVTRAIAASSLPNTEWFDRGQGIK